MRPRISNLAKAAAVAAAVAAVGLVPLFIFWPNGEASSTGRVASTYEAESVGTASTSTTEQPQTTVDPSDAPTRITVAAVGDVMIEIAVLRTAMDNPEREYDFAPVFVPIAPYLSAADYTVANLETRLAGTTFRYTTYPRYNSPDCVADALVASGIDLVTTANNHAMDKDWLGVVNTLAALDEVGLAHVGTHRSPREKDRTSPLIVDIRGIKVAFINYTDYLNGLSVPEEHREYGVNFLQNADQVAEEAEAAREAGADVVIALLHWGREYWPSPTAEQRELAIGTENDPGLLFRGVDVILGSHPHVLQPTDCVTVDTPDGPKRSYVVYSMANLLTTMEKSLTDRGSIVYVNIEKSGDVARVTGLSYMGSWVQVSGSYPRKVRILPVLPGVEPEADTAIGARSTKCMDEVWEYLHDMYYQPEDNIVPLDPAELNLSGD